MKVWLISSEGFACANLFSVATLVPILPFIYKIRVLPTNMHMSVVHPTYSISPTTVEPSTTEEPMCTCPCHCSTGVVQGEACASEVEQFLQCAQIQNDLLLCEELNEVLKECKSRGAMNN